MTNAQTRIDILNWVRRNRKDLVAVIDSAIENDGLFLLLAIGYEAGKERGEQSNA
jgi:hypothetical protein